MPQRRSQTDDPSLRIARTKYIEGGDPAIRIGPSSLHLFISFRRTRNRNKLNAMLPSPTIAGSFPLTNSTPLSLSARNGS